LLAALKAATMTSISFASAILAPATSAVEA